MDDDTDTSELRDAGSDRMWPVALYAGEPALALSHAPLRRVPPTAVNVHGHLHGGKAPTRRRWNMSVEQTGYAPAAMTWVLEKVRERT